MLRGVDDPQLFVATAEWRTVDDYRDWQAAYASLPKDAFETMLATLESGPTTMICDTILEADQNTKIRPDC